MLLLFSDIFIDFILYVKENSIWAYTQQNQQGLISLNYARYG